MRGYSKHEFDLESEQIQGRIRGHQIRGMRFDEDKAKADADVKFHLSKAARIKVETAAIEPRVERQKLMQKQNNLQKETVKTQQSLVSLGMEQDNLRGMQAERLLNQAQWRLKLEALSLSVNESELALQQRRILGRLKGSL